MYLFTHSTIVETALKCYIYCKKIKTREEIPGVILQLASVCLNFIAPQCIVLLSGLTVPLHL